jgi:hypothetical protein
MGIYGTESFIADISRTPLYPAFLCIHKIFPDDFIIPGIVIAQIVLFVFSSVLLFKALINFGMSNLISKWTCILLSLSPSVFVFTNEVLSETLFLFLLVMLLHALSLLKVYRKWALGSIYTAFSLASMILCRPVGLGMLIIVPLFLLFNNYKKQSLVILLTSTLFISPWIYRNYQLTGDIVLTTKGSTSLLYQTVYEIEMMKSGSSNINAHKAFAASLDWADSKSHIVFHEYALHTSFEVIMSSPGLFLKHYFKNCVKFFMQPMGQQICKQIGIPENGVLYYLIVAIQLLFLAFLYFGIVLNFRSTSNHLILPFCAGLIIYFMLVCGPFDVNARYRMPIMPLICIMATIGYSKVPYFKLYFQKNKLVLLK